MLGNAPNLIEFLISLVSLQKKHFLIVLIEEKLIIIKFDALQ